MGENNQDLAVGGKLRAITRRNLGIELEYIGFIPRENGIQRSIMDRKTFFLTDTDYSFSKAIDRVARKLISTPETPSPRLFEANEDIIELGI